MRFESVVIVTMRWKYRAERLASTHGFLDWDDAAAKRDKSGGVPVLRRRVRSQPAAKRARASTPGPSDFRAAHSDWSDVQQLTSCLPKWLERKLDVGLDITSHYSGTGAAEAALSRIAGDRMVPYSACDIDLVCQDVLLHHDVGAAPHHSSLTCVPDRQWRSWRGCVSA